jgi:hypothetical protein
LATESNPDYERLQLFAAALGWKGLQEEVHVFAEAVPGIPAGGHIRFWVSGNYDDIALHITENPPWYACVHAIRYRLHSGFHKFVLFEDPASLRAEAARLSTFLHRRWFRSAEGRKDFRRLHPECTGYTARKLAGAGPPYYYQGIAWPTRKL